MDAVRGAASDHDRVLLAGLHPLKHALRFGAAVMAVVLREGVDLRRATTVLAPDLPDLLDVEPVEVAPAVFETLTTRPPPDGIVAVAERPTVDASEVLRGSAGPVIVLEEPRHLGNIGACVRVAAAAGASGLLVTGTSDPWHPVAVRGGAGLQFALPVARTDAVPSTPRALVAVDPGGAVLDPTSLPLDAVLVFGTERDGVRPATRDRADHVVRLPMQPEVSSLNLATAVAVVLYALRGLEQRPRWSVR
ncbi:MAG: rRNA methyltransferase [Actinobacteria bacterium]|nr:rRNA methyltransferase [Actinomycetota bacterium]